MKPLEALRRLYKFPDLVNRSPIAYLLEQGELHNYYKIIETTLKEKEKQDSVLKTLREAISFEQKLPHIKPNEDILFDNMSAISINIQRDLESRERKLLRQWVLETCFPKELKALEIIVRKGVDVNLIKETKEAPFGNKYEFFSSSCHHYYLSREEFNLIKEVIKEK